METSDYRDENTNYGETCENPWHKTARARMFLACGDCAPEDYWNPGTTAPLTTDDHPNY